MGKNYSGCLPGLNIVVHLIALGGTWIHRSQCWGVPEGVDCCAPTSRASISHATVIKTNAVKDSCTLLSVKSATWSSAVNKHMSPRESLPLQPCCMQTHYQEYLQKQKSSQPTTWFNYFFFKKKP